ncbi:hypothetical protein Xmau_03863 [Xenorhabdus mauleonii]|uniref:DUF945 domain-containing protein n=1 Tax=Xenorhabdus mauleonii TaxID=351675 RepID=A0A1I3V9C7_9GAMM|nr:DUF932 domain-containing protein [Xenorhabdus mauleonii]PHM37645.1 hypothetical protein Xmau_03863 [Xenorhabdus mauleonii]SFJ90731.1 protein of unknown function [Xenorhabdus mauleonii]
MIRMYKGFKSASVVRSSTPLSNDNLMKYVPSIFSDDKHESRSERYTYIPTVELLDGLRKEGFQPFYACQTKVRDDERRGHARHMLRLRREGEILLDDVPEIILVNSHDGSSSYQMIPGIFRFVCNNGLVCGETFGDIRVPHKGDVVGQVIEGAYTVVDMFGKIKDSRDEMKDIQLGKGAQMAFAESVLEYKYDNHVPVLPQDILEPRRREDNKNDLWTTYQRVQENIIKGGVRGKTVQGKKTRTRSVNGITGDIKLNNAMWSLAEKMKNILR